MPKLDKTKWEAANESAPGEYKRMTPGVYDCIIIGVNTEWTTKAGLQRSDDRQCVQVLLDVAEGEFAGEYSDEFYKDKPYAHAIFMSWSDKALGMLKHTFHALEESNPGFDPAAAFEADQWTLFIGKRCKVLWNGTERTNDRGYTNVNVRPDRIVTQSDIDEDRVRPKVELERGATIDWADYEAVDDAKPQTAPTSAYDASDVPF